MNGELYPKPDVAPRLVAECTSLSRAKIMRIGNNIFALSTFHEMTKSSQAISRSLERLSTGKRINSAKDDQVGFRIAERINAQLRSTSQSIRNTNDGFGLLGMADSALGEMSNILQQVRDLALDASSGLLSSAEREQLHSDVQQLLDEFDRIAKTTEFNGQKLLDGSFGTQSLQVGPDANASLTIELENNLLIDTFDKTVGTGIFTAGLTYYGGNGVEGVDVGDFQ